MIKTIICIIMLMSYFNRSLLTPIFKDNTNTEFSYIDSEEEDKLEKKFEGKYIEIIPEKTSAITTEESTNISNSSFRSSNHSAARNRPNKVQSQQKRNHIDIRMDEKLECCGEIDAYIPYILETPDRYIYKMPEIKNKIKKKNGCCIIM